MKLKYVVSIAALVIAISWSITPAFTAAHRSEASSNRAKLMKGMGGGMGVIKKATDASAALVAAKRNET